MKLSTKCALSALFLSVSPGLLAQSKTVATLAGNSEIRVLNVARATATASLAPRATEELWSEGIFFNHNGRYYTASIEGTGSASNIGTGVWALRAGTTVVRAGWVATYFTGPQASAQAALPQMVEQFNVAGLPIIARATVTVNLSINARYLFRRNGVAIETKDAQSPQLAGNASATVTTEVGLPGNYFASLASHVMRFGSQEFTGKAEVWSSGDTSALGYRMGDMHLYLRLYSFAFGAYLGAREIVFGQRGGLSVTNFL